MPSTLLPFLFQKDKKSIVPFFVLFLFVLIPFAKRVAKFQPDLAKWARQTPVRKADQIAVGHEAITAFQAKMEPTDDIDLDARLRLDDKNMVAALACQLHGAAAAEDGDRRVHGAPGVDPDTEQKAAVVQVHFLVDSGADNIRAEVVAARADEQGLAELDTAEAAGHDRIFLFKLGQAVRPAAPDAGKSEAAPTENGFFALREK